MPTYTVQDTTTGKNVTFEWTDKTPPTDADMEQVFAAAKGGETQASAIPETQGLPLPTTSLQNVATSAVNTGKTMLEAVTHPKQTIEALGKVAAGGIEKIIGSKPSENTQAIDAMGQYFANRYGSLDAFNKTFDKDPVGVFMDASTALGGAGAAFGLVARLSGSAGVARVAAGLKATASATNPVSVATGLIKPIAKTVGNVAAEAEGMWTGTGAEAVKQAALHPADWLKANWGKITPDDLLTTAENGLKAMKDERGAAYQAKLAQITPQTQTIDITPIKKLADEWQKKFNVKVRGNPQTGATDWDFSRSTLTDKASQNDIKAILAMIDDWGNQPGDLTAIGVDTLKRKLDSFYSESHLSRAPVISLKNKTREILNQAVPGYQEMTKEYAQSTELIDEIQKALSLNDTAAKDTTLRKLTSTMRENFRFRNDLLKQLEPYTGENLSAQIGGYQMRPALPQGLVGKQADFTAFLAGGFLHDPRIASMVVFSSPRLVGNFIATVSEGLQELQKLRQANPVVSKAAELALNPNTLYQTGRIKSVVELPEGGNNQ